MGAWIMLVRRSYTRVTLTLQMRSPAVKQDWVVELRLARLALDPNNSPGWDILEQAILQISTKSDLKINVSVIRRST